MGGGIDLPGAQRRADHLLELAQPGRHPGLLVPGGCCTVVAVRRALRSSSTSYRLSPLTLAWLSCSGVMSAPSNRAQSSLIAVSGCSALHLFQVVATSCFNRSNCC